MRRLDKEFAELFEQFVIEGGGERIFSPRPGVLGVVPVRGSLSPEQMAEAEPHLDMYRLWRVRDRLCIDCAIKMVPVSAEEWFHVPSSMAEWEERRLEYLAESK